MRTLVKALTPGLFGAREVALPAVDVRARRPGTAIGPNDVYLNVAGGLKISEPAADLAVAAALASSLSGVAVPSDMVIFGEIGLSGEVRAVGHLEHRLKEASKLGFRHALIPSLHGKKPPTVPDMKLTQVRHLKDILPLFTEDN